jgi:hypothetical protein
MLKMRAVQRSCELNRTEKRLIMNGLKIHPEKDKWME